jgi:hypothetical protein
MNTETDITADITADIIDSVVDNTRGLIYLAELMGDNVSDRQAATMMLLLEERGSDVRHLLDAGRWADGDPAVDMDDDAWYRLVATACHIEAANRGGAEGAR